MRRVAAIDCGTNSIRLLVADVPAEGPHTDVLRRMEVVRLGQGVDATGRLAPDAIERTRLVLAEYAAAARDLGADDVRMVATSATRDAANRADFEAVVLATLGRLPDVVPGREEAELSFRGATGSLARTSSSTSAAAPPSSSSATRTACARRARSTSAACGSPNGTSTTTRRPPPRCTARSPTCAPRWSR